MMKTLFVLLMLATLPAHASELGFRAGEVTGRRIATALALTCAPDTYKSVAASGRLAHLENKSAIRIVRQGSSVQVDDMRVEKLSDGSWQASRAKTTVRGRDACELMMKAPKIARTSLFESTARADDIHEERTDDYWTLGIGTGLLALGVVFPPSTLLSAAFFAWDAYEVAHTGLSLATKSKYEDLLNHDFDLQCTEGAMVLKSAQGRIVVKKSFTKMGRVVTIDLFGNDRETPYPGLSTDAPKSSEFLRKLAGDCDSPEDATRLLAQLKKEREQLLAKVEAANAATTAAPKNDNVVN